MSATPKIQNSLGAGVQGPVADTLARVLDERWDALEAIVLAVWGGADINAESLETWALRLAGHVLGVPRDPSWTNAEWLYCLRGRAKSRMSHGTVPELIEIVKSLSPIGDGTVDSAAVAITAYIAGGLDLTPAEQDCAVSTMLASIPEVAGLGIVATTIPGAANVFTLDLGPGFDLGTLAGSLYP